MLPNGMAVAVRMAADSLRDPIVDRWREAILLGALRENTLYVPGLRILWNHWSFGHFTGRWLPGGFVPLVWPGPARKANVFFRRARRLLRQGRPAAAFVTIGRAIHLLADMACPVHVHRTVHEMTDPFEWWVEAHAREIGALPLPAIPPPRRPSDLVAGMAALTRRFRPDGTSTGWGRLLARLGLRRGVPAAEAGAQALLLLPEAAARAAALLRMLAGAEGAALERGEVERACSPDPTR